VTGRRRGFLLKWFYPILTPPSHVLARRIIPAWIRGISNLKRLYRRDFGHGMKKVYAMHVGFELQRVAGSPTKLANVLIDRLGGGMLPFALRIRSEQSVDFMKGPALGVNSAIQEPNSAVSEMLVCRLLMRVGSI
jgi:hypothetical protein